MDTESMLRELHVGMGAMIVTNKLQELQLGKEDAILVCRMIIFILEEMPPLEEGGEVRKLKAEQLAPTLHKFLQEEIARSKEKEDGQQSKG